LFERLSKYTTLPVLLDMLRRETIVLLDPRNWDDKNDSEIMLEYARRRKKERIFATCFSCGNETIHHWKTFADGISGCCIEFDFRGLVSQVAGDRGFRHGKVSYKKLSEIEASSVPVSRMPFIKRWPYRCEEEYRIIWEGDTDADYVEIPIPLPIIRRIVISQRMPQPVYESIKAFLREEPGQESRINRSTLYENKRWIGSFKE
jgi:hypothetical protein